MFAIIASLLLMAALDYVTGQEMVFSGAYVVPVALAAWWLSRRWVIVMSGVAGISALIVDELDGYEYANQNAEYWNVLTCFVICLILGLALFRLKESFIEKEKTNQQLRTALEKLEASTLEIRKLQSGLQTMCAWTKQIKVGEHWMAPDEFLKTQLHLRLSHGMSPEVFQGLEKKFSSTP